ncbi:MAG: hypothetical protein IGS03_19005 [Candidatus Sericytochromatia bacterium]|nr:hypothetical protein [Candidatus Sericytochromatia bacterium]
MPLHTQPFFWLSPAFRRQATQLYAQQMWAWGQDIRHAEGNLLKAYGFSHGRSIGRDVPGSSQYTLLLPEGLSLKLWSFGLSLSVPSGQGVLLPRHTFRPRLFDQNLPQNLARPGEWPESRRAHSAAEARQMYAWIRQLLEACADYEHWVLCEYGLAYRQAVMQRMPGRCRIPAGEMAASWRVLEGQLLAETSVN